MDLPGAVDAGVVFLMDPAANAAMAQLSEPQVTTAAAFGSFEQSVPAAGDMGAAAGPDVIVGTPSGGGGAVAYSGDPSGRARSAWSPTRRRRPAELSRRLRQASATSPATRRTRSRWAHPAARAPVRCTSRARAAFAVLRTIADPGNESRRRGSEPPSRRSATATTTASSTWRGRSAVGRRRGPRRMSSRAADRRRSGLRRVQPRGVDRDPAGGGIEARRAARCQARVLRRLALVPEQAEDQVRVGAAAEGQPEGERRPGELSAAPEDRDPAAQAEAAAASRPSRWRSPPRTAVSRPRRGPAAAICTGRGYRRRPAAWGPRRRPRKWSFASGRAGARR